METQDRRSGQALELAEAVRDPDLRTSLILALEGSDPGTGSPGQLEMIRIWALVRQDRLE